MLGHRSIRVAIVALVLAPASFAQWVTFVDETASRLDAPDAAVVLSDTQERDYAWADFDNDGDDDLVIVRKEPFISAGREPNVLLLNQNGVLTDRTADFAVASDVPGDSGFRTPTNDRDVVVVDVDLDGWLDLVTAATISPGQPKHIGHPRVYRNLGCTGACSGTDDWLGFEYQDARIPVMLSWSGQSGFNPCLCHVSAGDVTGDGWPDLLLVDYDVGCESPSGADFNSRLLVNQGAANPGHFTDETLARFLGSVAGEPFPVNVDSLSGYITDLNEDGSNEIVLESEGVIDIAYNDPNDEGFFDTYDSPPAFATYFMNVGDLNNDDLPDFFTTDDAADRYMLNQGSHGTGIPEAQFISFVYQFQHTGIGGPASDDGFGDDTIAADLNRDGWPDVLTADVDFEFTGCSRRAHIYHNLGGNPGDDVVLREETTGAACQQTLNGNSPACIVASIPADQLEGTHDIAALDINGDDWLDLVIGRCVGTQIWINQPPVGGAGTLLDGSPGSMLLAGKPAGFDVELSWGGSCVAGDIDYSVYEGNLGDFSSHTDVVCSTAGLTTHAFDAAPGSRYFLVVPHNATFEGSYGAESDGSPRSQGLGACRPLSVVGCD